MSRVGRIVLAVGVGAALVLGAIALSLPSKADEACQVPLASFVAQSVELNKDEQTKNTMTKLEGQELKAFESVVKSEFADFALEPTTVVQYFFEFVNLGVTAVVEVDAKDCVLSNNQASSAVIRVFISKMSAQIDKNKV